MIPSTVQLRYALLTRIPVSHLLANAPRGEFCRVCGGPLFEEGRVRFDGNWVDEGLIAYRAGGKACRACEAVMTLDGLQSQGVTAKVFQVAQLAPKSKQAEVITEGGQFFFDSPDLAENMCRILQAHTYVGAVFRAPVKGDVRAHFLYHVPVNTSCGSDDPFWLYVLPFYRTVCVRWGKVADGNEEVMWEDEKVLLNWLKT